MRILGQKPTKREFSNFQNKSKKIFFLEHSRKNIFEKSRFIKKYLVTFYKRNLLTFRCDGQSDRQTDTTLSGAVSTLLFSESGIGKFEIWKFGNLEK